MPHVVLPAALRTLVRLLASLRFACLAFACLLLVPPAVARAHEIPRDVTVRAFVHPEGRRLRVATRVPLEAMRDVEFALRGAGLLDVVRSDSLLRDAAQLWIADALVMYEDGRALASPRIVAVRASLPSDGAFASAALAGESATRAPLDAGVDLPWQQAMLDVLLEYDIASDSAAFSMRPAFAKLGIRTTSVVQFVPVRGAERAFTYEGDPGLVALDPGALDAAWRFLRLGFTHVPSGADHLLFLLCLVLPFRRIRPLVAVVTAFTLAHSLTLAASALGYAPDALWFPPLVELLIAASIVYMACENILGARLERRWMMAFAFGLVHGFAYSFALRESLQFAGAQLVASLAAFNVGIELAQLTVVALAVPLLSALFRRVPERAGVMLVSAFVAHTAWHWGAERADLLAKYRVQWPAFDAMLLVSAMRAAMVLIVMGAAGWMLHGALRRFTARGGAAVVAPLLALAVGVGALIGIPARTLSAQARATAKVSTMTGVYTAEQARQGRQVFTGTCTGCHTPAAHTGPVFTTKWVGRSVDDLFTYIRNSMPKIAPGSLTEDEYVWVTAYILKLNGMPAGASELSAEPAVLRTLRIDTAGVAKK